MTRMVSPAPFTCATEPVNGSGSPADSRPSFWKSACWLRSGVKPCSGGGASSVPTRFQPPHAARTKTSTRHPTTDPLHSTPLGRPQGTGNTGKACWLGEGALASPSMTSDSLQGRTINGYRLLKQMGEGGTAPVYRAEHPDRAHRRSRYCVIASPRTPWP